LLVEIDGAALRAIDARETLEASDHGADALAGDAVNRGETSASADNPARLLDAFFVGLAEQRIEHLERAKDDFGVRKDGAERRIDFVDDARQQTSDRRHLMQFGGGGRRHCSTSLRNRLTSVEKMAEVISLLSERRS